MFQDERAQANNYKYFVAWYVLWYDLQLAFNDTPNFNLMSLVFQMPINIITFMGYFFPRMFETWKFKIAP